jgi:hypothetical protein
MDNRDVGETKATMARWCQYSCCTLGGKATRRDAPGDRSSKKATQHPPQQPVKADGRLLWEASLRIHSARCTQASLCSNDIAGLPFTLSPTVLVFCPAALYTNGREVLCQGKLTIHLLFRPICYPAVPQKPSPCSASISFDLSLRH